MARLSESGGGRHIVGDGMHIRLRVGGGLDAGAPERIARALGGAADGADIPRGIAASAKGGVAFAWSGEGDAAALHAVLDALGAAEEAAWRVEARDDACPGVVHVATRRGDLGWTEDVRWTDIPGRPPAFPLPAIVSALERAEAPLPCLIDAMLKALGQGGRPELPAVRETGR